MSSAPLSPRLPSWLTPRRVGIGTGALASAALAVVAQCVPGVQRESALVDVGGLVLALLSGGFWAHLSTKRLGAFAGRPVVTGMTIGASQGGLFYGLLLMGAVSRGAPVVLSPLLLLVGTGGGVGMGAALGLLFSPLARATRALDRSDAADAVDRMLVRAGLWLGATGALAAAGAAALIAREGSLFGATRDSRELTRDHRPMVAVVVVILAASAVAGVAAAWAALNRRRLLARLARDAAPGLTLDEVGADRAHLERYASPWVVGYDAAESSGLGASSGGHALAIARAPAAGSPFREERGARVLALVGGEVAQLARPLRARARLSVAVSVTAGLVLAATLAFAVEMSRYGMPAPWSQPTELELDEPAVQLVLHRRSACAVLASGAVACWGQDAGRRSGGRAPDRRLPTRIPGLPPVTDLALGADHACALSDARVVCWGSAPSGLGAPPERDSGLAWPLPDARAVDVDAHGHTTCAVTEEHAALCWGLAVHPWLTDRDLVREPLRVEGIPPVREVRVGEGFACGLTLDGNAVCWRARPQPFPGLDIAGLDVGGDPWVRDALVSRYPVDQAMELEVSPRGFGCALSGVGAPTCFAVLDGEPLPGLADVRLRHLALADHYWCGEYDNGKVQCGGSNDRGQLGQGHVDPVSAPVRLESLSFVADVAATDGAACALRTDGRVWCWGTL